MSRQRRHPRAARLATALALCVLAVAAAASTATAAPRPTGGTTSTAGAEAASAAGAVRVRGTVGTTLTKDFTGFEGDSVRIEVDARAEVNSSPAHARGRFHVTHLRPDGKPVAEFEGEVDCLAVGGGDAILTGVITRGEAPWFPDLPVVGSKVALTVQDNGRADRVGWVLGAFGAPVSDCQGTVPFIRTTSGNAVVHG